MRLAPREVAGLVASVLSEELRWEHWRGHMSAVAGHCYTASEVCRALLGPDWHPYVVRHEGTHHWFLRHEVSGEILDPTAEQFVELPPYEQARRARFGWRYSAAAKVVILRVLNLTPPRPSPLRPCSGHAYEERGDSSPSLGQTVPESSQV